MASRTAVNILIVLLFPALTCVARAELSKDETRSLFAQANDAFREANLERTDSPKADRLYEEAILAYEKIIDQGQIKNSGLYYNLANTYLLKGDLGRAILNYRRAQKLDAADANIQKNLDFARSRRLDKVQLKTQKRVLHTLFFWHYDFPLKTKFTLTCIFFAVCCIALTVIVWFGRSPATTTAVVITGLLTLCFLASVAVQTKTQAAAVCGVITADEVIARQGDGQNYAPSFKEPLHTGTEFDLLENRTGWLHIKLADDTDTWIPDNSADLI
jgi:tetratricopeptide (TPR) repeat protein